MYNSHDLAIRIKEYAKIKGIVIKIMLSDLGLGTNTLSALYHGKSIAYDSLARIADYLDCSLDYLTGRVDSSDIGSSLPEKEKRLLSAYREQPNVQLAVDRLLGIDVPLHFSATTETKIAAFGGTQATKTADSHKTANILSEIEGEEQK